MKYKIIQILNHSLTPYKINVDPKYYEDDWHVKVAKEINKITDNFHIECWRPEYTFDKTFIRKGKEGIIFRIFPSIYFNKRIEFSLKIIREIKREINEKKKILLHLHGIYNFQSYLINYKYGKKIPIVCQSHGGSPSIINFKRSNHVFRYLYLIIDKFENYIFSKPDFVFCLTDGEKRFFSNILKKDSYMIQPMGIDFKKFKPINKSEAKILLNLKKDSKYLLYVGRINKKKGLNYLIFAFHELLNFFSDIFLIFIGDGPYKKELKILTKKFSIENKVKWIGNVKNEELPVWYNAADVVVYPSLSEGFPVVPIEAFACKTPVIGTRVGQMSKIFNTFNDGIIIPTKNVKAIKNSILEIFNSKNDPKINRNLGKQNFSWNHIIKNTLKIYKFLFKKYY